MSIQDATERVKGAVNVGTSFEVDGHPDDGERAAPVATTHDPFGVEGDPNGGQVTKFGMRQRLSLKGCSSASATC